MPTLQVLIVLLWVPIIIIGVFRKICMIICKHMDGFCRVVTFPVIMVLIVMITVGIVHTYEFGQPEFIMPDDLWPILNLMEFLIGTPCASLGGGIINHRYYLCFNNLLCCA